MAAWTMRTGSVRTAARPPSPGLRTLNTSSPPRSTAALRRGACASSCNRSAGRDIDHPWLSDAFVLDVRFAARIPDRRGNVLDRSPMLTGMTEDGRRVTMRRDGTPEQLNTPVEFDEETGLYRISAGDQEALDAQLEKQRRKAERQGKESTPGQQPSASDHPEIHGTGRTSPGVWYRGGAKIALALLAEQRPLAWRRGASPDTLREAINSRPTASQVQFVRSMRSSRLPSRQRQPRSSPRRITGRRSLCH